MVFIITENYQNLTKTAENYTENLTENYRKAILKAKM